MSSVFYYTKDSIKNFKELRHLQLVGQEDKVLSEEEKEQQGKIELYKNCAIFTGDIGLVGYPILEGDTVRSATLVELIDLGEQQLLEGEILNREAGTIDKIPQPSYQYKWDFEKSKWLPDEKLLQDGQYIEGEKIVDIPYDDTLGYLIPTWDKVSKTWKEGATEEQKTEQYKYLINSYKAQILEQGYNYNNHQQKCREKDLALLGNAVSALDDMQTFAHTEEKRINWAFNDDDIIEMSETDLRKMRIAGTVFINTVYGVEAELKAKKPNISLKKDEFIARINELSEFKCYEVVV